MSEPDALTLGAQRTVIHLHLAWWWRPVFALWLYTFALPAARSGLATRRELTQGVLPILKLALRCGSWVEREAR